MDVNIPTPAMTPQKAANYCIEVAFEELVMAAARKFGDQIKPSMGLMYLADLNVTKQFQEACRAVLRLQGAQF